MKWLGCGVLALMLGLFAVCPARANPNWIHTSIRSYPPSRSVWDGIDVAPPARRATYTAIAYSPSLGRQGWGRNYSTIRAAQQAAMRACGGRDARPVIWGASGSYLALAVGDNGAAGATGRTAAQARAGALQECRRHTTNSQVCVVVYAP
jgi:Domain of unknown function (DUF4189)